MSDRQLKNCHERLRKERIRKAKERDEMLLRLVKRDLEYERHGGCRVTVAVKRGVRVETRGQPCYGGYINNKEGRIQE